MARFGMQCAMMDPPVHDQTQSNARSDGQIGMGAAAHRSAPKPLRQGCAADIGVEADR